MSENEKFHTVRGYELMQKSSHHLTSAMEDYLEMIYRNSIDTGYIRTNTLSKLLNVKAASTTKMVQRLAQLGLIHYEKYGLVVLTDQGKGIGEFLLKRHEIIEAFLKNLGIESTLQEVELIEHSIDMDTLINLNLLNIFFDKNSNFLESFNNFKKEYLNSGEF